MMNNEMTYSDFSDAIAYLLPIKSVFTLNLDDINVATYAIINSR